MLRESNAQFNNSASNYRMQLKSLTLSRLIIYAWCYCNIGRRTLITETSNEERLSQIKAANCFPPKLIFPSCVSETTLDGYEKFNLWPAYKFPTSRATNTTNTQSGRWDKFHEYPETSHDLQVRSSGSLVLAESAFVYFCALNFASELSMRFLGIRRRFERKFASIRIVQSWVFRPIEWIATNQVTSVRRQVTICKRINVNYVCA